jgi:peptide/nickel transport system substrate-binding protein
MAETRTLTRGSFLKLSAASAVGATVSALAGKVPAALGQGQYGEAPDLAARVQRGELPPVSERLPQNPYVVPHKWVNNGRYGGVMRLALQGNNDIDPARRMANYMYGHSPLRWLDDGTKVGPGWVESWAPNEDTSVWTFNIRRGIKWSDGHPFTVDDVLFWWEDEVKVTDLKELPPDETRSGRGTLATFVKIDDYTFQMQFDAPSPLTADRMAMWVKRDPLGGGGRWIDPKHYLAPFHIKYNASLNPNNWTEEYLKRREHRTNPDCPVLTGWKLESIQPGQLHVYARNPYYWAVDKAGNQLPYIDKVIITTIQDPEVLKLQFVNGQVDFMQSNQSPSTTLGDVQALRQAEPRTGLEIRFWDSGGGTGSSYFFNWNEKDPKLRALVRNSTFLKALSHGVNRSEIQRSIYFNTGELTTGTMSLKAVEYNIPGGKGIYQEWRDAAVAYDPNKAKAMLDSIGVIDRNNDGFREYPDGSPLEIELAHAADKGPTSEHVRKNELIVRDWAQIGIKAYMTPRPEVGGAFDTAWETGRFMTRADWGIGDGPNHLVYPQWVVPIERQRWAPLNGRWYEVRGTPLESQELEKAPYDRTPPREPAEPGGPVDRLWNLYDQSKVEPDPMKRHQLVWEMIKIHANDGPFITGTVANTPNIVLVRKGLLNVPKRDDLTLGGFVGPWIHPTPAVYDPESWFWDNPAAHQ